MTIYQYGNVNNAALTVPGVYVEIVPPQVSNLNGVPSNIGGFVGTASWGPVNAAVDVGDALGGARAFGPMINRAHDLTTAINLAAMQGNAGAYKAVRVTDGTDTKATGTIGNYGTQAFWDAMASALNSGASVNRGPSDLVTAVANPTSLSLSGKYTGTWGANISVALTAGSKSGSYRLIVSAPGRVSEVFDNLAYGIGGAVYATGGIGFTINPGDGKVITLNGTAVTFATSPTTGQVQIGGSLSATLANLLVILRASSDTQLVKFTYALSGNTLLLTAKTAGTGGNSLTTTTDVVGATAAAATLLGGAAAMTTPTLNVSATLTGGNDGVASITATNLLGDDTTSPRQGLYALRGKGCSAVTLVDVYDLTLVAAQASFGMEEGCLVYTCGPAGDTISNAITAKNTNAIDYYSVVHVFGDWPSFNDGTNKLQRKVAPTAFLVGRRVNLSPNESILNKPLYGIVCTEKSASNYNYVDAEISQLYQNGFEVISNTPPGGHYFGCATGRCSSSDEATHNDSYGTMTNFIAHTLNAGLGRFVGRLQSRRPNDPTRRDAKATIDAFFANMANLRPTPMIDDFQVIVDLTNNSSSTIGAGYLFAACKVVYMSIVEFFVATLEGGQTVVINRQGTFTADQIGSSAYNAVNSSFAG